MTGEEFVLLTFTSEDSANRAIYQKAQISYFNSILFPTLRYICFLHPEVLAGEYQLQVPAQEHFRKKQNL